jgi:condensin complex subunit 1
VIAALEDKASSVRRYAIALLTNMIVTHPYGAMYGGLLNLDEWEKRHAQVKAQLEKVDVQGDLPVAVGDAGNDTNDTGPGDNGENDVDEEEGGKSQPAKKEKTTAAFDLVAAGEQVQALDVANITRLRLTKRYISDALQFIREVEGAMDILGQLLGSTSKAEVLEAIEFFKVAYEYQMSGAQVCPFLSNSCPFLFTVM